MKPLAITLQESHLSFTDNPEPRNYKVYRKDYYLGDFNAHNPLWGSKKLDDRGKEVEKFYSSHTDLFLLNTGINHENRAEYDGIWLFKKANWTKYHQSIDFHKTIKLNSNSPSTDINQKNNFTIALGLDIEKAYDRIWGRKILQKLSDWNINGSMFAYIQHFLSNNYIIVKCNGAHKSEVRKLDNGTRQGSSLSTTMFSIATCDIFDCVTPPAICNMFVDDICVLISGKQMNQVQLTLQNTLDNFDNWSKKNGLDFSASKTVAINFNRKRNLPNPQLTFKNTAVQFEGTMKWLGIHFDRKFDFKNHIEAIKIKALKAMNVLKILSHQSWGLNRKLLHRLYQAYVRPILDYGAIVYSAAKPNVLKKLDPVHNTAIRTISGAFRTSPIKSLLVDCGEMPLENRRELLIINHVVKLMDSPQKPTYNLVFQNIPINTIKYSKPMPLRLRIKYIENFNFDTYRLIPADQHEPPWLLAPPVIQFLTTQPKQGLIQEECLQNFREFQHLNMDHVMCYSDGSKSDGATGCAFMIDKKMHKIKLSPICTSYSAEMIAIYLCMKEIQKYAINTNNNHRKFILFTDSKSSLQTYQRLFPNSTLCLNVKNLLSELKLKYGLSIKLVWIPGHMNISGNCAVDLAAKQAQTSPDAEILNVTHTDLKSFFKKIPSEKWKLTWSYETCDNKLKNIKQDTKYWASSTRYIRKEEVVLTRLRIGHSLLTHKFLLDRQEPPTCNNCQVLITIKHILCDCPLYQTFRRKNNFTELTLSSLLRDDSTQIDNVMRFLRQTKLFKLI
ncbi:hypothetical protein M8J77_015554 [Diaphorina citri]|nr:hypothetical protein M8J77_015554 [Diaphorina citri]